MALGVGTRLGLYEITGQLGIGGMGEVYRATDTKLGREVAIKALPNALAKDADRLARFEREARVLAALNHPNIATIHGVEESTETPALVMELVDGETLEERIARSKRGSSGALLVAETLGIAQQIVEALEAAHDKGIVHRDLKPANVKITSGGVVKVLDFGVAKVANAGTSAAVAGLPTLVPDGTRAGALLGTTAYMSPEQARGEAVDARADIWAFGCVLYEMLTGVRAFHGDSTAETLAQVLEREPDFSTLPDTTPPSINRLLRRCLEKDTKRRLRHIGDTRFELDDGYLEIAPSAASVRGVLAPPLLSEKPSIAVLPFTNMSGDAEQEYFSDGISEDIITGLSRFHWFFVIARNSSFMYKGSSVDVKQIARDLGVEYVLEGSVRKAGQRVRITAQLIHAATDRHVWAERYDRSLEDIFALQDEISEAIVTAVAPAFVSAEAHRAERKAPENLDAWDYAMRGNWFLSRSGKNDIAEARRLFAAALEIDPKSTVALCGLAFALCWVSNLGFDGDLEPVRKKAYEAARRAIDLDDNDAWAHATLAFVFFTQRQLYAAIPECLRALSLNPSLAVAESVLAIAYSWAGEHDAALRHAATAERLSPRDPAQSLWSIARAVAEFGAGHYERSLECAGKTTEVMPEFPAGWRYVAACLGHLNRHEEARRAKDQLLKVSPHDSLRVIRAVLPSMQSERMERFVEGLRKAGLPEE